jgi:hypothetical protein
MKKSLIVCLLLTNLVFLGQSLLAQGSMGGGAPNPATVPANSESFGATIFWVGAAIFACVAAAGGIVLARKLHQQKALIAAGVVPAPTPAPRKLFSLPGNGNGNGSKSLKLNNRPGKPAKTLNHHANGHNANSKRRRMFNYHKFYTEMVLQGPSPTSATESNYAYNGYNGYYVEYEPPRINNNGNGHGSGNGSSNGHDNHHFESHVETNGAHAAQADLIAGQKSLIEEQQRLIHEQARLIEEKSRLIAEKNQLLERQSQMIDNNLV